MLHFRPILVAVIAMLFSRAAVRSLPRVVLTKRTLSTATKRKLSSTAAKQESASGASSGLLVAVGTTFGTYMLADFLSNFIQHPAQKVLSNKLCELLGGAPWTDANNK